MLFFSFLVVSGAIGATHWVGWLVSSGVSNCAIINYPVHRTAVCVRVLFLGGLNKIKYNTTQRSSSSTDWFVGQRYTYRVTTQRCFIISCFTHFVEAPWSFVPTTVSVSAAVPLSSLRVCVCVSL